MLRSTLWFRFHFSPYPTPPPRFFCLSLRSFFNRAFLRRIFLPRSSWPIVFPLFVFWIDPTTPSNLPCWRPPRPVCQLNLGSPGRFFAYHFVALAFARTEFFFAQGTAAYRNPAFPCMFLPTFGSWQPPPPRQAIHFFIWFFSGKWPLLPFPRGAGNLTKASSPTAEDMLHPTSPLPPILGTVWMTALLGHQGVSSLKGLCFFSLP